MRSTETVRVNVELEIGTLVETVEVSAAAQLLETETSTTGDLVPGEILTAVPTPQMKVQTVLYYMAGVTNQARIGHVAGQRSRSFQATMDGVSGMEPVRGEVNTNTFLPTVRSPCLWESGPRRTDPSGPGPARMSWNTKRPPGRSTRAISR